MTQTGGGDDIEGLAGCVRAFLARLAQSRFSGAASAIALLFPFLPRCPNYEEQTNYCQV
ncbi:hypothetical protein [Microseira wollei]|uniref:hypothetical protein n=1 Tax=Microseira wollei TaxID=467598 RepID=UPI001CFE7DE3|nr:hypothetical protein [Microseira wollei]